MPRVNPTRIDFEGYKQALRDYLKNQDEIRDYDYESSIMSLLLDVLAYNSSVHGMYANLLSNESNLHSALIRGNVLSRASDLGYAVRTARGATANVDLRVTPSADANDASIVADDVSFGATIDGRSVPFVLSENLPIDRNTEDPVAPITVNADLVQGTVLTHRFTEPDENGRYVLPNKMIDSDSIRVSVGGVTFTKKSDLIGVDGDSPVFFVQQNEDELVEILFGDGILGRAPGGALIEVKYRVTVGAEGNGIRTFTVTGNRTDHAIVVARTVSPSQGGDDGESIASIKMNAPRVKRSRGRILTIDDYEAAIIKKFGDVGDVAVWGGAENVPPDNGAVYISVQPKSTDFLSDGRQEEMREFLKSRTVIDRRHVFVRPRHLFVSPSVSLRYDPTLTTLGAGDLVTRAFEAIQKYENELLGSFDNSFYASDFEKTIAAIDTSVISVVTEIRLQRRFVLPDPNAQYTVTYNNRTRRPLTDLPVVSSTMFNYGTHEDATFDDDGRGVLRVRRVTGELLAANVGTIDYGRGVLRINGFETSTTNPVRVSIAPAARDVFGVRNQILFFADAEVSVTDNATGRIVASATRTTDGGRTRLLDTGFQLGTVF